MVRKKPNTVAMPQRVYDEADKRSRILKDAGKKATLGGLFAEAWDFAEAHRTGNLRPPGPFDDLPDEQRDYLLAVLDFLKHGKDRPFRAGLDELVRDFRAKRGRGE